MRMVLMELAVCRSGRTGRAARDEVLGSAARAGAPESILRSFFTSTDGGKPTAHQGGVRGDAQARMMMEAAPAAPFVMTQSYLLLKFLIVPLDPPAQLRQVHLFERE